VARVGRELAIARMEKLGRVVGFLWVGVVLPLLRSHFYVTETEGTRNRVVCVCVCVCGWVGMGGWLLCVVCCVL
jgi:hypothetical protein